MEQDDEQEKPPKRGRPAQASSSRGSAQPTLNAFMPNAQRQKAVFRSLLCAIITGNYCLKLLSMHCSTASTERNWSIFSAIYRNTLRNRMKVRSRQLKSRCAACALQLQILVCSFLALHGRKRTAVRTCACARICVCPHVCAHAHQTLLLGLHISGGHG